MIGPEMRSKLKFFSNTWWRSNFIYDSRVCWQMGAEGKANAETSKQDANSVKSYREFNYVEHTRESFSAFHKIKPASQPASDPTPAPRNAFGLLRAAGSSQKANILCNLSLLTRFWWRNGESLVDNRPWTIPKASHFALNQCFVSAFATQTSCRSGIARRV